MRMRYFQHVPYEPAGMIELWAQDRNVEIERTRLYEGESVPDLSSYDFLVVMGGPMNIDEEERHPWLAAEKAHIREAYDAGKHILGVCLGAQLLAHALGAPTRKNDVKEIGWFPVRHCRAEADSPLSAIPEGMEVLHWHGDTFDIPETARWLMSSDACAHQAFMVGDRALGLQFHLEATLPMILEWIRRSGEPFGSIPSLQSQEEMVRLTDRFVHGQEVLHEVLDRFFLEKEHSA